jgi:hypothetical protein
MTSNPTSRIRALERMAKSFEREGRHHEAGILRTTIHTIRVLTEVAEGPAA